MCQFECFIHTFVGIVHPSPAVVSSPSNDVKYHNPIDTKGGECFKNYFDDILLIIIYNYPFYDSLPLLMSLYKDAFKNIVICGSKEYSKHPIMVVNIGPGTGYYGYECVGEAIRRYRLRLRKLLVNIIGMGWTEHSCS
jgi:hypothetical protein